MYDEHDPGYEGWLIVEGVPQPVYKSEKRILT